MKFIFPQNYSFSNKLLGFLDYSTAIFFCIFGACLYGILHLCIPTLFMRLSVFILLFLPIVLLGCIGFNHEKITYVCYYMIRYFFSPRYYIFYKIPITY